MVARVSSAVTGHFCDLGLLYFGIWEVTKILVNGQSIDDALIAFFLFICLYVYLGVRNRWRFTFATSAALFAVYALISSILRVP